MRGSIPALCCVLFALIASGAQASIPVARRASSSSEDNRILVAGGPIVIHADAGWTLTRFTPATNGDVDAEYSRNTTLHCQVSTRFVERPVFGPERAELANRSAVNLAHASDGWTRVRAETQVRDGVPYHVVVHRNNSIRSVATNALSIHPFGALTVIVLKTCFSTAELSPFEGPMSEVRVNLRSQFAPLVQTTLAQPPSVQITPGTNSVLADSRSLRFTATQNAIVDRIDQRGDTLAVSYVTNPLFAEREAHCVIGATGVTAPAEAAPTQARLNEMVLDVARRMHAREAASARSITPVTTVERGPIRIARWSMTDAQSTYHLFSIALVRPPASGRWTMVQKDYRSEFALDWSDPFVAGCLLFFEDPPSGNAR